MLGSGAVSQTGTCTSRRAATGLGPRATILERRSASMKLSRLPRTCSTVAMRARVPTPVSRTTRSNSPRSSRSANASASVFDSRGTSRMEGAEIGSPP